MLRSHELLTVRSCFEGMDRRLEKSKITDLLPAVADLVLPRICIVCGQPLLPQEKYICSCCLADLPLTGFWKMQRNPMADRFNDRIEEEEVRDGERYAYACALYYYCAESPYDRISQKLKYWRAFDAGKYFSRMLAGKILEAEYMSDVDTVVPVPLHWSRRLERGYNQAEIIGQEIATVLGVPCRTDLLTRCRRTVSQTRLSGEYKERNVSGAFRATKRHGNFRHLLLVDDIFTSGSTSYECFKALRQIYGTEVRISVATLGFVDD